MVEYFLLVVVAGGFTWICLRYSMLSQQISALETIVGELSTNNTPDLRSEVAEMADQLKLAADAACENVTKKIEELEACRSVTASGSYESSRPSRKQKPAAAAKRQSGSSSSRKLQRKRYDLVPIDLIVQLADEGFSTLEIARRARAGLTEVEMTLKFRREKRSVGQGFGQDYGYLGKEVGIA